MENYAHSHLLLAEELTLPITSLFKKWIEQLLMVIVVVIMMKRLNQYFPLFWSARLLDSMHTRLENEIIADACNLFSSFIDPIPDCKCTLDEKEARIRVLFEIESEHSFAYSSHTSD